MSSNQQTNLFTHQTISIFQELPFFQIRQENIDISNNLNFLSELPFFPFDSSYFSHLDFSSAFRQNRISTPVIYREPETSPVSEFHISSFSPISLSPTNSIPDLVANQDLVQSFEQLTIESDNHQRLTQRLLSLNLELEGWIASLESEREQAILIVNSVTTVAIITVQRRIQPQIDRIEEILRRHQ